MLVIHDAWHSTDLPRQGVVTIGNYDGLHLGQRRILDRVVERGAELGCPSVVISFEPHPLRLLRPGDLLPSLTTSRQKESLLEEAGVEALLVLRFDKDLARRSAESFVRGFLHSRLRVREVIVGSSFAFGRGREGDVAFLERLARELGFTASGVEEVSCLGAPISSTRIRRAVKAGGVTEAAAMLGRPYSIEGTVVGGDRMGQRLGWPTINVAPDSELIPLDGVYACQVSLPGFRALFDCATNIGTRPTVYENFQRVVESHILDFCNDVYGERVEIFFHKRLREERLFPTIMDLSAQIGRDVEATREYFAARRRLEESGSFEDCLSGQDRI